MLSHLRARCTGNEALLCFWNGSKVEEVGSILLPCVKSLNNCVGRDFHGDARSLYRSNAAGANAGVYTLDGGDVGRI